MLSFVVLALALAASASAHSFSRVHRHHVPRAQPPIGWATNYLEVYDVYHTRYLAIGCEDKHNTTFFDSCCHPLLATETVAKNRPACCAVGATVACPGTPTSSTAAAASASAAADNEDEDCDDEDDDNSDEEECEADDDNSDDNDDGEDCDDGDEEQSSAAATSTKVAATSTKVAAATSTKVAPATPIAVATSTHPTPTTTSTHTTTTQAVTTTSTADTSTKTSSSSFITGGFGTWFTQNGVAGACGTVHKDTDFVVALQTKMYANGANCGRTIQVTDLSTGKTTNGVVADECPSCTNTACVDMSVSMFESFAALSVGEFNIKYQFLD